MNSPSLEYSKYRSPAGTLILGSVENNICMCDWDIDGRIASTVTRLQSHLGALTLLEKRCEAIDKAAIQLNEYFHGIRKQFDVPLMLCGTPFQQAVWQGIAHVEYGSTITYAGLASALGMPQAIRAVATACGKNPISILIPCHRIIGAGGRLTGYAGGLAAKRMLLNLESSGSTVKDSILFG